MKALSIEKNSLKCFFLNNDIADRFFTKVSVKFLFFEVFIKFVN